MKKICMILFSVLLAFSMMACGKEQVPPKPVISPSPSNIQEAEVPEVEVSTKLTVEIITEQGEKILVELDNSSAGKSLYEQLPLSVDIENFSTNEKIFYPPDTLDTSDTPLAKGPTGLVAYYAPWGNVAIYYGDCGGASGLYQLGQVVSGIEHISQLSGVLQIQAASDS